MNSGKVIFLADSVHGFVLPFPPEYRAEPEEEAFPTAAAVIKSIYGKTQTHDASALTARAAFNGILNSWNR